MGGGSRPLGSIAARDRVHRVRNPNEATGGMIIIVKDRNEQQGRRITSIPPQMSPFHLLGPQQGIVGRTDPSPEREPLERRIGISQRKKKQ